MRTVASHKNPLNGLEYKTDLNCAQFTSLMIPFSGTSAWVVSGMPSGR